MVSPFLNKQRIPESIRKNQGTTPVCAICGQPVNDWESAPQIVVIDGGAAFGPKDSDPNDPGHMGTFPIGPKCWQRYRRQLAGLAFYDDEGWGGK